MSKEFTKEDVIQNKKSSIRSLNNLLEGFINDSSEQHLKKAHLISYWIKDYVRMISFEENFEPTRNIAYKRGNIVKLNFGFNIGNEYGGLHYGIVLDNKNAHNSPVVTVIPLTSQKDNKAVSYTHLDTASSSPYFRIPSSSNCYCIFLWGFRLFFCYTDISIAFFPVPFWMLHHIHHCESCDLLYCQLF